MGKKAAGGGGSRRAASADDGDKAPTPSKSSGRKRKEAGWPWWVWAIGGFGLIVCLGQIFANRGSGSSKKARKSSGGSGGPLSTSDFLELAMRLQGMTEVASALASSSGDDGLDQEAVRELDDELREIEGRLGPSDSDDSISRDLRAMVSVVRGTLYQKSGSLSDEQVEGLEGNTFTYANPRYWDDYYNKTSGDEKFDWYGSWDTAIDKFTFKPYGKGDERAASKLGDILGAYLSKDEEILMFGCGNSDLSEKMYVDGFERIVNIDISAKLLDNLRGRLEANMPKMRWLYMNVSELTFDSSAFDVVIDKGTLDAIEQNKPLLNSAAAEAHRVVRPGGYLLSVTFNAPAVRIDGQLRKAADWGECHSHTFERVSGKQTGRSEYWIHACQKKA